MSQLTLRLCLTLLSVLLGTLAWAAGPATAATEFGRFGQGAGEFIEPNGIAVDQESGDVYVVDSNNERIEKFTREGAFLLTWGWGVADGKTEALQTCTAAAAACFPGFGGTGSGEFSFTEGVAVNNDPSSPSYHDVYVVDISNHRVEKFSPGGRFLLMFGGSVNISARERGEAAGEDICPVKRGDQCGEGAPGPARAEFEFPVEGNFIAVGSDGTVYLGDRNCVQEFSSDGVYQSRVPLFPPPQASGPEAGGTIAMTVDPAGDIYAVRNGVVGVRKYSPRGELEQTLDEESEPESDAEGPTPAIAIDPAGRIFADYHVDGHLVLEYNSSGAELPSFDAGMEDGLHGLAFGEAADKLYIVSVENGSVRTAHVRMVTPPPLTNPLFWGFDIWPNI
jgi:NHL repeat